jgi:hypothetical protein
MSPLNIHPEEDLPKSKKNNNKLLKILLGVSALILVPAIGTTLAANISVSSGTVQFGQGTATAAACDATIQVVPNATFYDTGSSFQLGTITVSTLNTSACDGKTLRFRFYPATGNATPLTVSGTGTTDAVIVTITSHANGTFTPEGNYTISSITTSTTTGGFTVTLATANRPATTTIERITVESY